MSSQLTWGRVRDRAVSAGLGALLVALAVTPFEVIKVRLQARDHALACEGRVEFGGTLEGLWKIGRLEGAGSLYRGLTPALAMSLPSTVVYYVAYEWLKERLEGRVADPLIPLLSGSTSRVIACTAVSPLELIKTRMQHHGRTATVWNEVRSVRGLVRADGASVLFRGLVPTLWRDVPFSAVYWTSYELMRKRLLPSSLDKRAEFLSAFVAGAASGTLAAAITIPFDVVKTRRQVWLDGRDVRLHAQLEEIWRREGVAGLTRGIVPRVGKVAPACAIMISSYEVGKLLLRE